MSKGEVEEKVREGATTSVDGDDVLFEILVDDEIME